MLTVRDLTLHYGHSQILNGISLDAALGQVTCVMGTNGVGKTSLMKAISGTHPRTSGEVTLDGKTIGRLRAHELARMGVGYVPQGREIFPLLTVEENLETGFACLSKAEYGIPPGLQSCHTAVVDGYVVEGHVPAEQVVRLLEERPDARGIMVPGMPIGSPGMEMGDRRDPYDVLLVDDAGEAAVFARVPGSTAP